jgi:hypothetical protein
LRPERALERALLHPPCSTHLVHRFLLPDPPEEIPRGRPFL